MDISKMATECLQSQGEIIKSLTKEKDNAYWERNQLVAAMSRLFPSYVTKHPESDAQWEKEWRGIVVVEIPRSDQTCWGESYQLSWHYHDSDAALFAHLPEKENQWDEHTTEEKYERLAKLESHTARGCVVCGESR